MRIRRRLYPAVSEVFAPAAAPVPALDSWLPSGPPLARTSERRQRQPDNESWYPFAPAAAPAPALDSWLPGGPASPRTSDRRGRQPDNESWFPFAPAAAGAPPLDGWTISEPPLRRMRDGRSRRSDPSSWDPGRHAPALDAWIPEWEWKRKPTWRNRTESHDPRVPAPVVVPGADTWFPSASTRKMRGWHREDRASWFVDESVPIVVPEVEVTTALVRIGIMAGQQTLIRRARGLQTWRNRLTAPEGSLLFARNSVIDRDNVISSRRGLARNAALATAAPSQLFQYLFRLVVLDGTTLKYDSDGLGTLASWPGTYSPPPGVRMRGSEIDEKFYFLTDMGMMIQSSPTDTPRRSGIPRGLDVQLALSGAGGSWFEPDGQVGYRIVFGRDELPPGAPSFLATVTNTAASVSLAFLAYPDITVTHAAHGFSTGDTIEIINPSQADYIQGAHTITVVNANTYTYSISIAPVNPTATAFAGKASDVTLTATLPADVTAGMWYEVYRTTRSAQAADVPLDDGKLIIRNDIGSTDVSNGFVTFLDTYDDSFRGINLYTNEGTGEGILQQNDRPPFARFVVPWQGHAWLGWIYREHQREIRLTSIEGITDDVDSITISVGAASRTYTFSTAEDVALKKFRRHTKAAEGTSAVAVRKTAQSLTKIINRDAGSPVNAFYVSAVDEPAGKILIERRDLIDNAFHLNATAAAGPKFSPVIPASGTSIISSNSAGSHKIAPSKFQKYESMPRLNELDIGKPGFEILGMVATKESLLIATKAGMYEVSGETDKASGRSFVVREVDTTLILIHPDTFFSIDNVAIGWFRQGLARVSSAGYALISQDIRDLLDAVRRLSNFGASVFSVPYESDLKYLLFVPDISTSGHAELAWVYDVRLNEWSGPWEKSVSTGIIIQGPDPKDDRLYLGHSKDAFVLKERKDFSSNDLVDEDIAVTLSSPTTVIISGQTYSKVTVAYSYSEPLTEGWLLTQDPHRGVAQIVTNLGGGNYSVTLDREIPLIAGAAFLSIPIEMRIEWVDEAAGNVGIKKEFTQTQVYMEDTSAKHHYLGWISNSIGIEAWSPRIDHPRGSGWGSDWGAIWGDPLPSHSIPVRAGVPKAHRRCETIRPMYRHKWALEAVNILQLAIDYNPISSATTRAQR